MREGSPRNKLLGFSLPFHYGWLILGLTFVTALTTAGVRSASPLLIHPLELEFGWSRGAIATAISLNLLLVGAAAPGGGYLLDRFGPRRMMLASLGVVIVALTGTLFMTELWHFVVFWGIILGLAVGGGGGVLAATVANRWFVASRGLALGILNSAHSTGQLIFLPLLMFINVAMGWRTGFLVLSGVVLMLLPLVALWMRDNPSQVGALPYGSTAATAPGATKASPPASVSFGEALRTSSFWLLAGSFFVCGATSAGLIATHLVPHAIERGIPEVAAAATIGIMGGMNFVGTLISGWLTDRVNTRKLLATVYALRGVSLFVLPFVNDLQGLTVFAVIYGLDWFASVPPTIVLTADAFGRKALGSLYGWIFFSHQLGGAVAAIAAGLVYEWVGDYQGAFIGGGLVALAGAAMALGIPARAPAEPAPARAPATA